MRNRSRVLTLSVVLAGAAAACAARGTPGSVNATSAPEAPGATSMPRQEGLVPAGFGTLKQDEVTLSIRSGGLLVKVTPLSEHVIRLTAPDTYTRLHNLAENRRAALTAAAGSTPELFLVSFFSYQPNVTFQPEDLQLMHQGKPLRPVGIDPVTSGWGKQVLQQQENQIAVYAFESPIDYDQPMTLRYGMEENDGWNALIPKLRTERSKVQSRAGTER